MLEQYREFLTRQDKAKNTISSYIGAVRRYMLWYSDSCGLSFEKLYRANVLDYISFLRTVRKLSGRTVNADISALATFNQFLIESEVQKDVVVGKRDFIKIQQEYANPSSVSKQQVEEFRQRVLAGEGKRDYAIVTLLAYGGLRVSEAVNLELRDVNLPAREVTVRSGKGDKERIVYIGDRIVNALREYQRERSSDSPYIFVSRAGGALHRSRVNKIFNKYSDTITPHTLRHFFCSQTIEAGYSIAELANQAGHSNVHTTLIYTNPTREEMKAKANLL